MSDPIADLLTRLRNASQARRRFVDMPSSKMKESVVKVLKNQGYVAHYLVKEENRKSTIRIFLKYTSQREPVIQGLKRVSKPSCRRYVSYQAIPKVLGGMGIALVSTPQGILEGKEAKSKKVGGELLCLAW